MRNNTPCGCLDSYTISEQVKSVRLRPRSGEEVMAIIIDGCVITDNQTKCDGLFWIKAILHSEAMTPIPDLKRCMG